MSVFPDAKPFSNQKLSSLEASYVSLLQFKHAMDSFGGTDTLAKEQYYKAYA